MLLDFLLEEGWLFSVQENIHHFVRVFIFWPNFKNGKLASMPYKFHLFLTICTRLDLKYVQCNHEHINVEHRTYCTSAPFAICTVASTCCHMHYWLKIAAIKKQVRSISSQFGDASMETFWVTSRGSLSRFPMTIPFEKMSLFSLEYGVKCCPVIYIFQSYIPGKSFHFGLITSKTIWQENRFPGYCTIIWRQRSLRMGKQGSGTYIRNVISCQDQAAVAFGLTRTLLLLWIWRTC